MITIFSRGTFPPSSWSGTIARRSEIRGLCLILDAEILGNGIDDAAEEALQGGVRMFQYRDKTESRRLIYETSLRLCRRLRAAGALLIINDHADIAVAVGADGVHLGQDDLPLDDARTLLGPDSIVGISTHSTEQAFAAQASGADYIGFGPVFATTTKVAGPALGLAALRSVSSMAAVPVIAIGGINRSTAAEAVKAGAAGVAVISAVLASKNRREAAREIIAAIESMQSTSDREGRNE